MAPTLFTIGNVSISTYTVLLDLGLILGLALTYLEGKRRLGRGDTALDVGLWCIIGGIIGGRIGYVLANWSTFSEDWTRAVRIWEGGLAFHGAFLGGLLVLAVFSLLQRPDERYISFWKLGDLVTPGLALGITFGWAACLLGGCAYGVLGEGLGYAILPDLYGVTAPRYATQVVGLAFALVLFVGFWLLRKRWPFAGASFLMYGLLYFAGQFFLEFTRGDEAIYVGPWRLAQALDLALALAAAVGLMVLWWQANRRALERGGAPAETAEGTAEPAQAGTETAEGMAEPAQAEAETAEGMAEPAQAGAAEEIAGEPQAEGVGDLGAQEEEESPAGE
jgi:phosphatidylglycerol:prolipoprotein diacylglycerol transferase